MKCELAAALVHRPRVLFLDEPTIGLDVAMQLAVRAFIRRYNEDRGATLLLTSHSMDDVVALCPRVIVMDHGVIVYDGPLDALARRVRPDKLVTLRLRQPVFPADLESLGALEQHTDATVVLRVDPSRLQDTLAQALARLPIADLTVQDPPIEEVMTELFAAPRALSDKA
jgi:ABC-2 type transport system ATP-binding protein